MNKQLFVHISEYILTIIYVLLIWIFYKGNDYVLIFFEGLGYLIFMSFYCFLCFLLESIREACEVTCVSKKTCWRVLLSNVPWIVVTLIILYLFSGYLGYFACLPILLPNCVYLLFLLIQSIFKHN